MGNEKKDNIWYKVDSIEGVCQFNLEDIQNNNNIGLIIPRNTKDLSNDIYHLKKKSIDLFLKSNNLKKRKNIWEYCFDFESSFSTLVEMLKYNSKIIISKDLCNKMIKTYEDFSLGFELRKVSLKSFYINIPVFLDILKYVMN